MANVENVSNLDPYSGFVSSKDLEEIKNYLTAKVAKEYSPYLSILTIDVLNRVRMTFSNWVAAIQENDKNSNLLKKEIEITDSDNGLDGEGIKLISSIFKRQYPLINFRLDPLKGPNKENYLSSYLPQGPGIKTKFTWFASPKPDSPQKEMHLKASLISSSYRSFIEYGDLPCDLNFKIAGQEIQAHKNVLMENNRWFQGIIKEAEVGKTPGDGTTCIDFHPLLDECGADLFKDILRYLYTGSIKVDNLDHVDYLITLLEKSHKFTTKTFSDYCIDLIGNAIKKKGIATKETLDRLIHIATETRHENLIEKWLFYSLKLINEGINPQSLQIMDTKILNTCLCIASINSFDKAFSMVELELGRRLNELF